MLTECWTFYFLWAPTKVERPNHPVKFRVFFFPSGVLEAQLGFTSVGCRACAVFPVHTGYWAVIAGAIPYSTKHADSIDLELEVDPLNVDHFSCTPLVRRTFIYSRAGFPGWHRDTGQVPCVVPHGRGTFIRATWSRCWFVAPWRLPARADLCVGSSGKAEDVLSSS